MARWMPTGIHGTSSGKNSGHRECRSRESQSITSRPSCAMTHTISTGMADGSESAMTAGTWGCGSRWAAPWLAAIHGWQVDSMVRGQCLDSRGTLRVCDAPLRKLGIRKFSLVLGPSCESEGRRGRQIRILVSRTSSHGFIQTLMLAGSRSRPPKPTTPITIGGRAATLSGQERAASVLASADCLTPAMRSWFRAAVSTA